MEQHTYDKFYMWQILFLRPYNGYQKPIPSWTEKLSNTNKPLNHKNKTK